MPNATQPMRHNIHRRTRLAQKQAGISARERILTYLQTRAASGNPIPPSFREIMDACQISSTSVVWYHLNILEKQGAIVRGHHLARGMFVPVGVVMAPDMSVELEKTAQELLTYWIKMGETSYSARWVRRAVTADEIPHLARAVVAHATRRHNE